MKTICRIPKIELSPDMRERLIDKFAIGEVVKITIKGEAYIHPSIEIVPVNVKITVHEDRSLPELRLYWWCMEWLEENLPEDIEKRFGVFPKIAWHEHLKSLYGLTSISFDNLDQDKFHEYFKFVTKWIFSVFQVDVKDIVETKSGA